ncbi:MAG: hypothetical protein QM778_34555 [Myxococcales bacterium]
MKAFVLWMTILGWGLAASLSRAQTGDSELVLLEVSEADAEDAQHLGELLDRPARVVRLPATEADPVAYARAFSESDVLVLDRAQHRVSLLPARSGRGGGGEILTRNTDKAVASSSYAVSFVAAELLTIVAHLRAERAARFGFAGAWLQGSADVFWGSGVYAGMWRPAVALGTRWSRPEARLGLAVELAAAFAGRAQEQAGFGAVDLVRNDLDLRMGPTYRRGRVTLLGLAELGLALRRAEYSGPGGSTERAVGPTLGALARVQCGVLPWLFLFAEGSVAGLLARADFAVQGMSVLRESAWYGRAGVGLGFAFEAR